MSPSPSNRKQQVRDYLIACGTAFTAATLGLFNMDHNASDLPIQPSALLTTILIFGGATALFFLMLRLRTTPAEQSRKPSIPPLPPERMIKMTALWYGLSIILAVGMVRQTWKLSRQELGGIEPLGVAGIVFAVAITIFALWRLYKLWRSRHRSEDTEST